MDLEKKPMGYWSKERCHEEALKYKTRKKFQVKSKSAYTSARRKGIVDEICSHMEYVNLPTGYWSKERCHEEALKYTSRWEFQKNSRKPYSASKRNGWLDEVCSHMKRPPSKTHKGTNLYWTKEKCQEESLKYKYKKDFKKNSGGAYSSSSRNKWLDEICSHMEDISYKKNVDGYWTKEKCQEESLKYDTRIELKLESAGAYLKAYRNGWLNEICSHMKINYVKKPSIIYGFFFDDKHFYIGLSKRPKRRYNDHLKQERSPVYKHIQKTSLNPTYKILFEQKEYNIDEIKNKEEYFLEYYSNTGLIPLNSMKTGSIGGNFLKWSKENCRKESLKYKTRKEFIAKNQSAYNSAYHNNWLDEVCSHMPKKKQIKKNGYWDYVDNCMKELEKYDSLSEFRKNNKWGYTKMVNNGFINPLNKSKTILK